MSKENLRGTLETSVMFDIIDYALFSEASTAKFTYTEGGMGTTNPSILADNSNRVRRAPHSFSSLLLPLS